MLRKEKKSHQNEMQSVFRNSIKRCSAMKILTFNFIDLAHYSHHGKKRPTKNRSRKNAHKKRCAKINREFFPFDQWLWARFPCLWLETYSKHCAGDREIQDALCMVSALMFSHPHLRGLFYRKKYRTSGGGLIDKTRDSKLINLYSKYVTRKISFHKPLKVRKKFFAYGMKRKWSRN